MATKKDLVEAYSFSRRRLVTAFLSGAPDGREVEPSRPGRTVVGGLALAVLLVAAAAIASVLASKTEEDWNKVGLVVSREEAAPYVILKEEEHPTLIPVINITSAQLILGADLEPTYVEQEVIEDQTPGDPIGIFGAPQTLPRPHQFINTGWTACTDDGLGVHLDISSESLTSEVPGHGLVVVSEGIYYVLAKSSGPEIEQRVYRYPVADMPGRDEMLRAIGLVNTVEAMRVPPTWIGLFPDGGELGPLSFAIEGWGKKLRQPGLPDDARVGDFIEGDQAGILTRDGLSPLDPFALAVYRNTSFPPKGRLPRPLDVAIPQLPGAARAYAEANWPDAPLDLLNGQACARLDAVPGEVPKVALTEDPRDEAAVDEQPTTDLRPTFSIDRGHGALVRVGDWDQTTSGAAFVVDPRGFANQLVGEDTLEQLGYLGVDEPLVPDAWMELFERGVELSTSLALCPPLKDPAPDQVCADPVR